jgi:hypothetical protein
MKRLLFTAFMATAFLFGANAQTVISNDYSSPITGADGQGVSQSSDDEAESYSYGAVGFYSFDGFENWGITYGGINPNGIGLDFALRMNFKKHGNFNADVLLNYSLGLVSKGSTQVALTLAFGPSFRTQDEFKGFNDKLKEEWDTGKFFCDGVLNPRLSIKMGKLALSAGYFYWAPKFKFSKDDGATGGFNCSLGLSF